MKLISYFHANSDYRTSGGETQQEANDDNEERSDEDVSLSLLALIT